ncbi:DUF47 domain-containing protein [Lichenifustis flavocetrariae]|uniref:DUF47 family protein n=1 Tax=Lichenifustis flavocetrariae TaxID=2949735 RepID=A0AA41Z885_9HYPH|nr:DUF47 family protein [Lichenifustis flavocetrariae]MCW6512145.1 DUF47 family protein [Lichenifustis flavocetrariae]
MKTQVLDTLGEDGLALPAQIEAGLAANDRLKYYFSLLQVARSHADHPDRPSSSLKRERLAAGIHENGLDELVAAARQDGASYRFAGCSHLMSAIMDDARIMAAPADAEKKERLALLLKAIPHAADDKVLGSDIDTITRADDDHGDSLHRLVMDLHKVLNALQVGLAEEKIGGAAAYHLGEGDKDLVRAFMEGVNRTAPLKFDHPGLGTTATRSGTRLIIQNDIGTTDAHVIVVHVEANKVSLTYSDVHLQRLQYFQGLLEPFAVVWSNPNSNQVPTLAGGQPFFLSTATFDVKDNKDLLAYLDHLGSRLVFLIDWNHARKQLRGFLVKEDRSRLLRWAADADVGHRGFLQMGGARLIWSAVETAAVSAVRLGDRLCDVLGTESAYAFVQFVFTTASEGLRARQSDSLIRDRVRAELLNLLHTAGTRLLGTAADHAGYVFEIATAIRDQLVDPRGDTAELKDLTKRARHWEHEADLLVAGVAEAIRRRPELEPVLRLIQAADDATDSLEEATFLLSLLDDHGDRKGLEALQPMATVLVESAQEWVKALNHARHVRRHGLRDDADDFLVAIDRLVALEHDADTAERDVTVAILKTTKDFRSLHVLSKIWHGLGDASDSLKRASLILRDHVVGDVLAA